MLTTGSWRLRSALIVCIVPLGACQGPPTSVDEASPSAAPGTFSVIGEAPVIEPADYGVDYLLPGAAVSRDGTYHLFPVTFTLDGTASPRVLHLTSDDGGTWSGDRSASVLADFAIELDGNGPIPASAFVTDDGTWVMHGGGRLPGGTEPIVWRATAPTPNGPWTALPDPVFMPDVTGWDNVATDHPAVLPTQDGYLMAYGGAGAVAPNRSRIGMARSTDGQSWTRTPASNDGADDDLALGPDACGVDARSMFEPHLFATDGGYRLIFGVMLEGELDAMEIHAATSSDGTTWSCASGGDAITSDDFPGAPSLHSFVAVDDGTSTLILVEVLGDESSTIWLVRATW